MKIVVNIIMQNNEKEIQTLLNSLKPFDFDGVVAVDGGSKDKTKEIVRHWGEENKVRTIVADSPWCDDFGAQRNICLNHTRVNFGVAHPCYAHSSFVADGSVHQYVPISKDDGDIWVLMIDTDDTLVAFDRKKIEELIAKHNSFDGIMCEMDNGNGIFRCTQFFRLRDNTYWKDPIHEYVMRPLPDVLRSVQIADNSIRIKRGISANHITDPYRNIRIERRFVEREPNNSRALFYLSRDLVNSASLPDEEGIFHTRQFLAESEGHLRHYMALPDKFTEQDRYALLILVKLLEIRGQAEEAKQLLQRAVVNDPMNKSAFYALAHFYSAKSEERTGLLKLSSVCTGLAITPIAKEAYPKWIDGIETNENNENKSSNQIAFEQMRAMSKAKPTHTVAVKPAVSEKEKK